MAYYQRIYSSCTNVPMSA